MVLGVHYLRELSLQYSLKHLSTELVIVIESRLKFIEVVDKESCKELLRI